MAIERAVVRHWLTLETILQHLLTRPWAKHPPAMRATLLCGAAQILYLDGVPDHAAIDESVELAKSAAPRAAGVVNAVLRKVAGLRGDVVESQDWHAADRLPLGDGRVLELTNSVFDDDPVARIAAQTSHGRALVAHWIDAVGIDVARTRCAHDLMLPPITVTGIAARPGLAPHEDADFHIFEGARGDLRDLLATSRTARVQDPGSARPVRSTAGLRPGLIVDACAGRGTKTRQLAALHPESRIIATDVDDERRDDLADAFRDDEQVEVITPDAGVDAPIDLLVLDVPCTNSGVLARRPEARYRFDQETLDSLTSLQRQIVANTIARLAPGGHVLYCTCSLEAAENEEQVAWIARQHRLDVVASETTEPRGRPGDPTSAYADGGGYGLLAAPA